jgi:glycosyltransferase domain-containing protein
MDYKDSLTILVPLWGRFPETLRMLKHMSDVKMPFKILLADGGGNDHKEKFNKKNYPDLNLEYISFGRDNNIHDFMVKMNKSCQKIDTPLTIMVDNDDLLSVDGLIKGIKFLNNNHDYTSYRGDVHCVFGEKSIYKQPTRSASTALDRFIFPKDGINSGWHDIVRTYTLKTFFEIMDNTKTNDLQLVFSINRYWHTLYGKSYKDNTSPFYYHIAGNSLVWDKGLYSPTRKWFVDGAFVDSMGINISMVYNLLNKKNELSGLDGRVIIAKRILSHLAELNGIESKDFNIVDKKIVESLVSSYNYDELVLSTLDKPNKNTTFVLSGTLPEISLDYGRDKIKILELLG